MIELDVAAPALRPLASPALTAFAETIQVCAAIEKVTEAVRPRISRPVLGLMDGIDHWGLYATFCTEQFAAVGIARDMTTHSLTFAWDLKDGVRVQLKSDTNQLCSEQLVFPGMGQIARVGTALIALTWNHDATGRFDPTFAHLENGEERWRVPVSAIAAWGDDQDDGVAGDRQPIKPITPKSSLTSRLKPAAESEPEDGASASS
jgi:hypothetical protein